MGFPGITEFNPQEFLVNMVEKMNIYSLTWTIGAIVTVANWAHTLCQTLLNTIATSQVGSIDTEGSRIQKESPRTSQRGSWLYVRWKSNVNQQEVR